jgi:NAD(P)-dependent dehydrogenase (short-subunit alcohol dehydrogenase family)
MKKLEKKATIITGSPMGTGLTAGNELAAQGADLTLAHHNQE